MRGVDEVRRRRCHPPVKVYFVVRCTYCQTLTSVTSAYTDADTSTRTTHTHLCQATHHGAVTPGHDLAPVRVKVQVSTRLQESEAQTEDGVGVGMNDVNKIGVGGVEPNNGVGVFEVRLGGIQAGDAANSEGEVTLECTANIAETGSKNVSISV